MERAQLYTLRYRKYRFKYYDTKYIPTVNDYNLSKNGNHFFITSVTGIKRFTESFKPMEKLVSLLPSKKYSDFQD